MINANNLVKRFGDFTAVKGITLAVEEGEIFGLLGPNGAGKTTTISMLSTILAPTSGEAKIAGFDVVKQPNEVRHSIGIVFQDPSLDEDLTGWENLEFHARLYGMNEEERKRRIAEVLLLVELTDKKDIQTKNYSGGMKRRLEIARGLIHHPKVLFLDEPTIGLDPQTRRHLWEYIKKMNVDEKMTILITTHYMDEADVLCDRVAVIDHGEIIALDTPANLKKSIGESAIIAQVSDAAGFSEIAKKEDMVLSAVATEKEVRITVKDGEKLIPKLIRSADEKNIIVESISLHTPTLEDVFVTLTGRHIREEEGHSADSFKQMIAARRRH